MPGKNSILTTGLKTLFAPPQHRVKNLAHRHDWDSPLAALSVGSPPAQLCASLRVRRFASASGVRSGTQPTVVVAKGKIANCRVLRAFSQTARFTCIPPCLLKRTGCFTPAGLLDTFRSSLAGPTTSSNLHLLNFPDTCEDSLAQLSQQTTPLEVAALSQPQNVF